MSETNEPGPLAGIRVVDFSQVAAGPYLASFLGDFGADVVKVEPYEGDSLRGVDEAFGKDSSSYFFGVNRSKRDIALDLRAPRASEIVERLARGADVLIVGMRPSAIDRSGLGYEHLSALNPRLIHVSISGFGDTGPRADDPGMDILAQALSGVMGLTGEPDRAPVRVGPAVVDIATSYLGCFAVAAAIIARGRDGKGQRISLNLLDSAVSLLPNYATQFLRTRRPIRPEGGAHPQIVPYQVFRASDGYMIVACLSDRFWPPLCAALALPDLATDPRYRTNVERVRNREALVAFLSELFLKETTAHWMSVLRPSGVPCSEVRGVHEVFDDPQIVHNRTALDLEHPVIGRYQTVANPIRMSRTGPRPHGHAPLLGEHTREILGELGYTPAEIESLREEKVIRIAGPA